MEKDILGELERMQNEFSVKLSDCIGLTGEVDAAVKLRVMENYCEAIKASGQFSSIVYEVLRLLDMREPKETVIGAPGDVGQRKKEVLDRYV